MKNLIGQRLYVYWNIHKNVWSVMQRGKIVGYCRSFSMEDVELRVRRGGNARAMREGVKNVHAFAIGTLTGIDTDIPSETHRVISYNPFTGESFYDKNSGEIVLHLERAHGGDKVLHA